MARKTKLTPELQSQICAYISSGSSNEDTCKLAGIGETTFYDWIGRFPEFSEAIKRASVQFRRTHLLKIAADDAWQASAWILERRFPDEYGRRPVEVTGKDGGTARTDGVVHVYIPDNGRDNGGGS